MLEKKPTAAYKVLPGEDGNRYRFFCDLSGMAVITTDPVKAETQEEELRIAWETQAKEQFNVCHNCGAWISDAMYNADTFKCVKCSPYEFPPDICPYCGKPTGEENNYCVACGKKLYYERGMNDDK